MLHRRVHNRGIVNYLNKPKRMTYTQDPDKQDFLPNSINEGEQIHEA